LDSPPNPGDDRVGEQRAEWGPVGEEMAGAYRAARLLGTWKRGTTRNTKRCLGAATDQPSRNQ
ncbi:unnamed protein product, partial [Closterium sp. NIES-64]